MSLPRRVLAAPAVGSLSEPRPRATHAPDPATSVGFRV